MSEAPQIDRPLVVAELNESFVTQRGLPLIVHLLGIAALLSIVMVWLGPGRFTIDESAYLTQADALADGSFGIDYPTAGVIEQNTLAPLALSQTFETGWTPYSRHPLYPILIAEAQGVSPQHGAVLLSIAGSLMAAVGIGRIRFWLDGGSPVIAMWAAALLSPLTIHSQVVWAHTLSIGVAAVAIALALDAATAPSRWLVRVVGAALALAVAAFLRTEGPFVALALVAALWFVPELSRRRWLIMSGLVLGVVGIAAGLDRLWSQSIVDGSPTTLPGPKSVASSLLADRVSGSVNLFMNVGGGGPMSMLWLLVPLLLVIAWTKTRGSAPDTGMVKVLCGGAVMSAAAAATVTQTLSGWLPAMPMVAVALLASVGDRRSRPMLVLVACLTGLVVATVPAGGGGLGWGGRYLLLSLPAVAALAVVSCDRMWREGLGKVIVAAGLIATVLVQINGLRVLDRNHDTSVQVEAMLDEVMQEFASDQVLVAPDIRIGRTAPKSAMEAPLLSPADLVQLPAVMDLVRAAGIDSVVFIELVDFDAADIPPGWRLGSERENGPVRTRLVLLDD